MAIENVSGRALRRLLSGHMVLQIQELTHSMDARIGLRIGPPSSKIQAVRNPPEAIIRTEIATAKGLSAPELRVENAVASQQSPVEWRDKKLRRVRSNIRYGTGWSLRKTLRVPARARALRNWDQWARFVELIRATTFPSKIQAWPKSFGCDFRFVVMAQDRPEKQKDEACGPVLRRRAFHG